MFNYRGKDYACSFELALDMFSRKWNAWVLYHLSTGTKRYGELKRLIQGITQKMLTQTLRELERYELIHREVYPVVPPKVEYSLTMHSQKILPILHLIQEFGDEMFLYYQKKGSIYPK